MGHYPFMVNDEEPVDHGKADGELGTQGQDEVVVINPQKPKNRALLNNCHLFRGK